MIFDVITTEQADNDLRGIYEYIAFELLSPNNAASHCNPRNVCGQKYRRTNRYELDPEQGNVFEAFPCFYAAG